MKKILITVVAVLSVALIGWLLLPKDGGERSAVETEETPKVSVPPAPARPQSSNISKTLIEEDSVIQEKKKSAADDVAPKEEEDEEERLVNDFDAMTDAFMEAGKKRVEMKDIVAFCEKFAKVPKERKDECLHRALNLIPDENVMLLAGILMDKSQDSELIDLVFNDILNRDEAVKQPLLEQVFKDRNHPNWADAAWILDVTGKQGSGQ